MLAINLAYNFVVREIIQDTVTKIKTSSNQSMDKLSSGMKS